MDMYIPYCIQVTERHVLHSRAPLNIVVVIEERSSDVFNTLAKCTVFSYSSIVQLVYEVHTHIEFYIK